MGSFGEIGERLIPTLIDEYAHRDGNRVWASVPINSNQLSQGFTSITYRQFADAIDRAAFWLKANVSSKEDGKQPPTFAYAGSKDLRYPILTVAAAKCRMRILLCSPFATSTAQSHLLTLSNCTKYLHSRELTSVVERVVSESTLDSSVASLEVPDLETWLQPASVDSDAFECDLTWEEAKDQPWLLFHTSGTTGLPKLVPYTHLMFSQFDAADLMTDTEPGEETMNDTLRNRKFYVSLPHLHSIGTYAALQWTVYLNMALVVGPSTPASGLQVLGILQHSGAEGALMPPSLIEDVCRQPGGIDALRRLYVLYFAGAPLARHIAIQLNSHCKLVPGFGSTETGCGFISLRNGEQDQWEYYRWRDPNGVRFDARSNQLFELVFERRPDLERFQMIFQLYPNLHEYRTGDLWTQHPTRKDLWKYAGRTDDMVIFSHGEDLYAMGLEQTIQEHPSVRVALVGGEGRSRPFLLLDPMAGTKGHAQYTELLQDIWPFVEKANAKCSDYVKLTKQLVLFTSASKPLPMTAKDTVQRRAALELYRSEIAQLYFQKSSASR